jgi:hypothetical protein
MKYHLAIWGTIFAVIITGLNFKPVFVKADQNQPAKKYLDADLKNGALLYDNWMKLAETKPEGNHSLYPANANNQAQSHGAVKNVTGGII